MVKFMCSTQDHLDLVTILESVMPYIKITPKKFLEDKQGRTFSDVLNDPELPFEAVLEFFSSDIRQQRMENSEIHHDRAALAGVVREFESQPQIEQFLTELHHHKTKRFRQAVGVVVRMIMEARGWEKTGRKGSLGVRAPRSSSEVYHNTGGLSFWFIRAERYKPADGMPFKTVQERGQSFKTTQTEKSTAES